MSKQQQKAEYEQAIKDAQQWCRDAIGRTENEVREMAGDSPVRVASRDGEQFALTCDYKSFRLNLEIAKGVVVACDLG